MFYFCSKHSALIGIATKIKDFKIVSIFKKMNCCCVEFKDYFTVGDQNALKTEVFLTINIVEIGFFR
jgi:hypothetical protein